MTKIAILPEPTEGGGCTWRAVSGDKASVGRTAGEALDALSPQLADESGGTLVIVQSQRPDRFFTADQQQRLGELMARWRAARDAGQALSPDEQAELDALVECELRASGERAGAMLQELTR